MVYGIGAVGGETLEILGRTEGVDRIVACDINEEWGEFRTNMAATGCVFQGFLKKWEFHKSDIRNIDATARLLEEVAALPLKADEADPKDIEKIFRHLEKVCEQKRQGVGITQTRLRVYRSTEMRYVGQAFELEVPFPEGKDKITKAIIQNVIERFHNVHQNIYQHSHPGDPAEFIAYRVVFSQEPEPMPPFSKLNPGAEATPKGTRHAYFDEYQDYVDTPLYERAALVAGQKIKAPAIVEQEDTTTVIYPGQQAEVDDWGNLILVAAQ